MGGIAATGVEREDFGDAAFVDCLGMVVVTLDLWFGLN